jgi:hypothetical protein
MLNHLKKLNEFQLNEDVNADLVKAKADVNAKQAQIAEEIAKQKDAADMKQKAVSIRNQARLTAEMPGLLNALANAMDKKAESGDTTNIY